MSCPFEAGGNIEELRRAFRGGRLDALFKLVDAGKISIQEAVRFPGLSKEEAEDILFGWWQTQKM